MEDKNYAEVLIDGKIYTLGGAEDQQYLQKVAAYITEKMTQLRRQDRFSRQSQEYQAVMVALNIADDYFKALAKADAADRRSEAMEKETYGLKHELVVTQMSLERREQELEQVRGEFKRLQAEKDSLTQQLQAAQDALAGQKAQGEADRQELLKLRALNAAALQGQKNGPYYPKNDQDHQRSDPNHQRNDPNHFRR